MYTDFDAIKTAATSLGDGWSKATITLKKGDRAFCPGTTKYDLCASNDNAMITYWVTPEGMVEICEAEGVFRSHKES